ncbi:MAG: hypothetical protein HY810_01485 [Candidatus Omnitrophica bacterium]|nr:hypothetical protein [Candidatus Omnitrophota bacterium]
MDTRHINRILITAWLILLAVVLPIDNAVFAANVMMPDNYTFAVINNQSSTIAPIVQNCIPEPDAMYVPRSSNIQAGIVDTCSGVDIDSINLTINKTAIVINGVVQEYQDINGNAAEYAVEIIEKSVNEYVIVYDPAEYFNYEEQITVSITVSDLKANMLNAYSYAFKIQNFVAGSVASFADVLTDSAPKPAAKVQAAATQFLQDHSLVRTSDDGKNVFICWEQCSSGGAWDIYCARSTDFGNNFEIPVKVSPAAAGAEQRFPSMSLDSANNVYIAWQQKTGAGDWDIYIAKMEIREHAFGLSRRIYADSGLTNQVRPHIMAGPPLQSGTNSAALEPVTIYAVWREDNGTAAQICFTRTTAVYSDAWHEFVPLPIRVDNDRWPQVPDEPVIRIDAGNRIFIAWRGINTDSTAGIYFDQASASLIDAGESFGTDVTVSSRTAANTGPKLELSSDGNNVYLLWKELNQGLKFSYYRYNYPHYTLAADRYINAGALTDEALGNYAFSINNNQDVTVVWSIEQSNNRNICMSGALHNTYQFFEYTVLKTIGEQINPYLAMDAMGRHFYVSWTDNSMGFYAIYYCRNTFIITDEIASRKIENDIGGAVTVDKGLIAGTSIFVPPGAIEAPITITIAEAAGVPDEPADVCRVGKAVDFGPGHTFFKFPAGIQLAYTENELLSSSIIDERFLQIYYYNIADMQWNLLPGALVDTVNNRVSVDISDLAMYMIAGNNTEQVPGQAPLPDDITSSSGGSDGGGSGCFIATAAFGTKMAKDVRVLCEFRDRYLLTNALGKNFVSFYYRYSPPIAVYIAGHDRLKAVIRVFLKPLIWVSQAACR